MFKYNLPIILLETALNCSDYDFLTILSRKNIKKLVADAIDVLKNPNQNRGESDFRPIISALRKMKRQQVYCPREDKYPDIKERNRIKKELDNEIVLAVKILKRYSSEWGVNK